MNLYTTLEKYALEKRMGGGSNPYPAAGLQDHQRMQTLRNIEAASRAVDTWCKRHFYPLRARYYFDFVDSREIQFGPHDLVEAETVYTANGDDTIASDYYYLMTGEDYNYEVKDRLRIDDTSGYTLYVGSNYQQANSIMGVWTYHNRWSGAWMDSLDTVKTNLTASATSLAVNHVNGVNGDGYAPRFQVGQLLQIESEWLYVADTDSNANTVTVARAQNGTMAAAHDATTAIYIYTPMADIVKACQVMVDYFAHLPQVGALGKLQMPGPGGQAADLNIPVGAQQILAPYRRVLTGWASDEYSRIDPAYLPPIGSRD